ncbi:hypothetical protein J5U23_01419 [Saccharolobus shibatae B12]|uniref:Uncharacterized protein n=1 Tax=Saccharolobus shibatae (strain ATCC 51178 / DSM 5389 / JCM 8931 / NBRC 15437 / B12) TaxID=523848 RepID=A0A8F5BNH7_SACSH|nr:hypothetical protein [Saccharolobus shibatae]QXJ28550.1 hypothetical protein J5U23_01419 [Saccharolobus shibatae B12]
MILNEAVKTSPRYTRGKEIKRRGYAKYKSAKESNIVKQGRRIIYKKYNTLLR